MINIIGNIVRGAMATISMLLDFRSTESGETRVTENGDRRVFESD